MGTVTLEQPWLIHVSQMVPTHITVAVCDQSTINFMQLNHYSRYSHYDFSDPTATCMHAHIHLNNLTTNLAAVVCVCVDVCQCAKFDQFLPARSHFESKRRKNFVRIAKFPYAAFGPLFAFHCPLFFTRNNDLECKSSRFAAVVRRSVADKQLA